MFIAAATPPTARSSRPNLLSSFRGTPVSRPATLVAAASKGARTRRLFASRHNAITASASVRVGVLGASGYTGAEIVRLLSLHPQVEFKVLTADRKAGKPFRSVFPHLARLDLPDLVSVADVNWNDVDCVFCCLPHATTQEIIKGLPAHLKIVDLSADFRLKDVATYAKWYGHEHLAPELQEEAVYGLSELYRDQIRSARLIANPGCYPTCSQLPLYPLLKANLILPADIIIDAKSGVSGAGRSAKENLLFTEIAEGINPYGVASHRHAPEIEQGLSEAAGTNVTVSFTPHLMPMSRGMLCTSYVKLAPGSSPQDLAAELQRVYASEPFVHVLPFNSDVPHTRYVRGSNHCVIGVFPDRVEGRAIIVSVIDNLVKGASGQAIQNFNLLFGLDEETALKQMPMFP
eukprot:tig00000217_g19149.t1